MSSSTFKDVLHAPPIAVFKLVADYNADESPDKVNLTVGAYRDSAGKPWVLPVVRAIERLMAEDETLNHEYLPIEGLPAFTKAATRLVLGAENPAIAAGRTIGVQALSGTGALRLGLQFIRKVLLRTHILIPEPTWPNHRMISEDLGYLVLGYRYWDPATRALNLDGLLEDLEAAPEGAVVMLHSVAHNPTGMDPDTAQWERIADVVERRSLLPFFDTAYQGFVSGDVDVDAWVPRYFVSRGFEAFIAQSFAKNFGLYNERAGNLVVVTREAATIPPILSNLQRIARMLWSNPPAHGVRVVATALENPAYLEQWKGCLLAMTTRIRDMRQRLMERLMELGTPGTWDHIVRQKGMFSYTGLTGDQVDTLKAKYHVYMMRDGRISVAGLTPSNLDYVAKCFDEVIRATE